jgi:hypothetical protein
VLLTSPFFASERLLLVEGGIEGVANQQLKPPLSPFEKGGRKETAISG